MIKAVIIDDETHSIETLKWKIEQFCDGVQILATFNDPEEGLAYLKEHDIDLLFLDIEMPKLNGFDVLSNLDTISFDVVFTTAYDEFGIKAIKFSALDYLLKPIQPQELQRAIEKHQNKAQPAISSEQLQVLFSNIGGEGRGPAKIALATKERIEFVKPEEIVSCESDSNYTLVYLVGGRKRIISRTLKDFEDMLGAHNFFRSHHSHLVNLSHIKEYVRSEGGYLLMTDDRIVPVSRSRKEALMNLF
ncbi:MAG: LytTR family DNA-binding domain-containing protein [Saprospiraceae bacterium]|nr:LytTR family DNA-binding domain-containing protein [Saprospiraceae bacterium]